MRTYLLVRLIIVTLLFGLATWLLFTLQIDLGTLPLFYPLFIVAYGITAFFAQRLDRIENMAIFSYSQFLLDVLSISVVVVFTGSSESLFAYTYIFVILAGGLILRTRGALVVATMATAAYLSALGLHLLDFEPIQVGIEGTRLMEDPGLAYRVSQVTVQIMGFYLIAWLSGTLASRLQESQIALHRAGIDLAALRELYGNIIENIGSGILTVDDTGHITSFNRSAASITGADARDALNVHVDEILPKTSQYFESLSELVGEAGDAAAWMADSHSWEAFVRLPSGERRYLRHAVSTLRDKRGKTSGKILIFDDQTRYRRMEDRLERERHLAQVGKLSAAIVHEIRNPLAAISGSAQLMASEEGTSDQDRQLLDIMVREADRLNGLVSNFLGLARARPMSLTLVQVDACIAQTLQLLRQNGHAHADLVIEEAYDFRPEIEADQDRLHQVFWNLFNNAIEAMPHGGTLKVSTDRSTVEQGADHDTLRIRIEDTGEGIPPDAIDRIFDPFYTRRSGGTGLGLAISRRIIQDHGGQIEAMNGEDMGTTFEIRLPVPRGEQTRPEAGDVVVVEG
jgi:two-component system, NtrC family, sensor histidine kinase PilS